MRVAILPHQCDLFADLERVHTGFTFFRVELGGILEFPYSALVHLLGDPAVVADVRVPVPLVERDEDTLGVGRALRTAASQGRSARCSLM